MSLEVTLQNLINSLSENERIDLYECISTPHSQSQGHVGVSGAPIHSRTYDNWPEVQDFMRRYKNNLYLSIVAYIEITETTDAYTATTTRYVDLYKRNGSVA